MTDDDFDARWAEASPSVSRTVLRYPHINTRESVEDIVQEVRLVAWMSKDRRTREDGFRQWACGIARNVCREAYRKGLRTVPAYSLSEPAHLNIPDDSPGAHELLTRSEISGETLALLERVPKSSIKPLLLFAEGLSYPEIGRRLSLSGPTVRYHVLRAQQAANRP
jgi:RNA polymerase sigma factor (sigma-70 family)